MHREYLDSRMRPVQNLATGYSIFGIAADRNYAFKWLFPQEKAAFHGSQKVHMYSENALVARLWPLQLKVVACDPPKSRYQGGKIGDLALPQLCNPLNSGKLLPSLQIEHCETALSRENWGSGFMGIFTWLFKGKNSDDMDSNPADICSAEDYELFINYLRGKERAFSQPGRSIKEEFKFWLADHTKKQAQAANYHSSRRFAAATQK